MDQNTEQEFLSATLVGTGPKRGSEHSLVLGEGALDMDSLSIDVLGESPSQLAAVPILGPGAELPAIDSNDAGPDPQGFSTQFVVMPAVVGGIGQDSIPGHPQGAIQHRWGKVRESFPGPRPTEAAIQR